MTDIEIKNILLDVEFNKRLATLHFVIIKNEYGYKLKEGRTSYIFKTQEELKNFLKNYAD